MTNGQLAELTQLRLCTVQKIDAGYINVLTTTAQQIQKALGCTLDSLLG